MNIYKLFVLLGLMIGSDAIAKKKTVFIAINLLRLMERARYIWGGKSPVS